MYLWYSGSTQKPTVIFVYTSSKPPVLEEWSIEFFFFGNIISINLSSQSNLSKSKKFQDLNLYDF